MDVGPYDAVVAELYGVLGDGLGKGFLYYEFCYFVAWEHNAFLGAGRNKVYSSRKEYLRVSRHLCCSTSHSGPYLALLYVYSSIGIQKFPPSERKIKKIKNKLETGGKQRKQGQRNNRGAPLQGCFGVGLKTSLCSEGAAFAAGLFFCFCGDFCFHAFFSFKDLFLSFG